MNHVFVNKEAVLKLWYQCIMCLSTRKLFTSCSINASCLSTRKQFKSCGVNALCVCQQESSLKVVVPMIMFLSTGKQSKSCGVNALCVCQQESSL